MSIVKLSGQFFILMSMFPWVSFGLNSGDSQPWPIVLSALFLTIYFCYNKANLSLLWPLLVVPVLFFVFLFRGPELHSLVFRAFAQYIGFGLILVAAFHYVKKYGVPIKVIVFANIVYIFASILQLIFGDQVFEAIVNVRTSSGRGKTSLAPEPTFFAIALFFFSWIYFSFRKFESFKLNAVMAVNVFFILFVAKSSMVLLYLALWAALSVGLYLNLKYVFFLLSLSVLGAIAFIFYLDGDRIFSFVSFVFERGVSDFFYVDASANARLAGVVLPVYGFIDNNFMPAGFLGYYNDSAQYAKDFNNFFWFGYHVDKIMSFVGSYFYELGFFGFFYIFWLFSFMFLKIRRLFPLILLFLILLSAVPIGFSIFPMFVAVYCFGARSDLRH